MNFSTLGISAAVILSFSSLTYATDNMKDSSNGEVKTTTSHNPLTKTTTRTTTRKSKRVIKTPNGNVSSDNELKVEKKTSDDGSKVKVRTEETHTDEQKN